MTVRVTLPAPSTPKSSTPRIRDDGWTPDRRRLFLEAVAAGTRIEDACAIVGLSRASAYALRSRDSVFALGWSGAALRSREAIADELMGRVMTGHVETWTLPDGTEGKRRRYDNRLGLALLTRLDRLAEQQDNLWRIDQPAAEAARGVAHDFGGFLDLVEQGEAEPAVNRFVDARICQLRQLRSEDRLTAMLRAADPEDSAPATATAPPPAFTRLVEEAVRRVLAGGEAAAAEDAREHEIEDEIADEPDAEIPADYSDEPAPEPAAPRAKSRAKPRPSRRAKPRLKARAASPAAARPAPLDSPVEARADHGQPASPAEPDVSDYGPPGTWIDPTHDKWRTKLPPPAGFDGFAWSTFGQADYWRSLTPAEIEAAEAHLKMITPMVPVMRLTESERRYFGLR